jgi:hypothetical protein
MFTAGRIAGVLLASLLALTGLGASAQDAITAEVRSLSLTEAGLARYSQATRNLAALEPRCDDDESDSESIDDIVASLAAVPGAEDAVQSAGMTLREYVVFSLSIVDSGLAAWAASQPGGQLPAGVAKANVDFVSAHDAELTQLGQLASEAECDGGDYDDDVDVE